MDPTDRDAVAVLLTRGFAPWREADFWMTALDRLAEHSAPAGLPRLGYVLEASGVIVGVLLLISSETEEAGRLVRRCNVSSWYVEPAYRLYGTLLVRHALRHRDVTYMNVTPAPETWKVLAAQGYVRYASGRAIAVPGLAWRRARSVVAAAGPDLRAGPDLGATEIGLLLDHARWGCLSLVCAGENGREPFVFGLRRRHGVVRFAYLIYCRGLDSFAANACPLGRYLLRRGIVFVVADADATLPAMPGWYQDGFPKFFRGGQAPRPGDLAYTERAIFGV